MIHCIGNSHVSLFTGEPSSSFPCFESQKSPHFRTRWLGPTIAYNFKEHHFPKVKDYLKNVPTTDAVMLIVGEVDCRWHLPFQADKQKKSIEDITRECVERFFGCLIGLRDLGYQPIGWGTHPTTTHGHVDPPGNDTYGPIFGDVETRNKICILWNRSLEELCQSEGFPFVSIYRHLVDEKNVTKMEYLQDYCHLSNDLCVPLVFAEMCNLGILQL